MSIRSDVAIKCEQKAYERLKQAWEKGYFYPKSVKMSGNEYYVTWERVKWEPWCVDVGPVLEALRELDSIPENDMEGYRYKMIRIGESDDDIETRENHEDIEFDVIIRFDIPEEAEKVEFPRGKQVETERGLVFVVNECSSAEAMAMGYSYSFSSQKLTADLYSKILDDKGHRREFVIVKK